MIKTVNTHTKRPRSSLVPAVASSNNLDVSIAHIQKKNLHPQAWGFPYWIVCVSHQNISYSSHLNLLSRFPFSKTEMLHTCLVGIIRNKSGCTVFSSAIDWHQNVKNRIKANHNIFIYNVSQIHCLTFSLQTESFYNVYK